MDSNILIKVDLPRFKNPFSSAIISISTKKNTFTLDELHPHEGHDALKVNSTISINTKSKGVETHFTALIKDIGIEDDIYFYTLKFPKEILYAQRREAFRVPTTSEFSGNVTFTNVDGVTINTIKGKLQDISATGFGGITTTSDSVEIEKQYECTLHFQKDIPIQAIVIIKFLGAPGHKGQRRFGATFISIQDDRTRLQKLVTRIERDLIRRGNK